MSDGHDIARNKSVVRRCVEEVWNQGKLEAIPDVVHPAFRLHHQRNQDKDVYGIEGFATWVRKTRERMPDLTLSAGLTLAESDRVMVRMDAEGTQRGMPAGVGRETRLAFTVTGLTRLIEGKIAECWVIPDTLAILQQLGEVEPVG